MVKLKKRLPVFLMTVVIIPGLIISILGIYLVSQHKSTRLLNIKKEFTNRLIHIQTSVENQVQQLTDNVFQQINSSSLDYNNPEALPAHLKTIVLNNPIVKYPFFITSQNNFLFPLSKKTVLPVVKSPALDVDGIILKKPAKDFFTNGYKLEYRERNFSEAVKFYLKSLQENPNVASRPYIYNAIARCYFKLNQFPQGANYYHKILYQHRDLTKKDSFLYFTVLRQLALSYKQMESVENAVKFYLQLYEEIFNYELDGKIDTSTFAFFKNEALDYLNRCARKNNQQAKEDSSHLAKAMEQLRTASELDISLRWSYFDMEWEEKTGGAGKENEEFKFLRLRELYESNDEKAQFYKAIKKNAQWSIPPGESTDAAIKQLNSGFSNDRPFEIAFKSTIEDHPEFSTIFFGFMLSFDFIKGDIILPIAGKQLDDPEVFIKVSDAGKTGDALVSVPFRALFRGKVLTLHSNRGNYFETIVQRDIRLYYLLLAALILTLALGIFLFYKYLSREAALVRLKAEFVDSASHTLKTPLTRISLLAENVKQGWVTGESQKEQFFDTIIAETARMSEMIDNMLNFSRIEAGKQHYEPEKIYLQEITAEIIHHYSAYFKKLRFQVEMEIDDHLPALFLDPEAVKLIIGNLMQNAIKYSLQEKYIKIRVYREGEFIVFTIEDRGIGIPRKQIPHIFKKFSRAADNRVRTIEGSGLGLFLVRHAVEAHKGQVKVKSTPGQGSTFSVYFPIRKSHEGT